jgi:hypothetical protein
LEIVKALRMGEGLLPVENMHYSRHVLMDQIDELEVSSGGKIDGKSLPLHKRWSCDASRTHRRWRNPLP